MRLNTCRLLNVGLQRQAIYLKGQDQTSVRLHIYRLLNVGSQRQATNIFLNEKSDNCEVKYLSVAKYWFTKTNNLIF